MGFVMMNKSKIQQQRRYTNKKLASKKDWLDEWMKRWRGKEAHNPIRNMLMCRENS